MFQVDRALSMTPGGLIRRVRTAQTRVSGKPEDLVRQKSLRPPLTVNLPDDNICRTRRHWKRASLAAVIQENDWANELKEISTVSLSSLMSYFINPGGANQISSFRSEELPRNWRPEADGDKSSPESGVCLRLLKTRRDLSLSYLSCLDDRLSFGASRWPFVSDGLLILFSPPLPWLFSSLLIAVVLPSSSPGEKEERTAAASRDGGKHTKKKKHQRQRNGWRDWVPLWRVWLVFSFHLLIPTFTLAARGGAPAVISIDDSIPK